MYGGSHYKGETVVRWCMNGNHYTGKIASPDSKVHGVNMGPIWGRQDPAGPHVGPMDFVIWFYILTLGYHNVCNDWVPLVRKCEQ